MGQSPSRSRSAAAGVRRSQRPRLADALAARPRYENGVYGVFTNPIGVDYDTSSRAWR